ncbi:hypothetical protein SeMB42_g04268 [Synchytrium endobioticum]|uniref:Rrp15p-domain-containing protein n=1 Tax=Synchytrium endobioticum TaxID=286115 RepID=A0A507CCT2_9FUNG|nr:hypothetical protein SeLEV6574_g07558 [Synchytrium endobioticum]TPX44600.1 hypothetical protein SeMB42_g04268 [Synchytrium endobioticum]
MTKPIATKRIRAINRDLVDGEQSSKRARKVKDETDNEASDGSDDDDLEELDELEQDQDDIEAEDTADEPGDEGEEDEYTIRAAKFADTINNLLNEQVDEPSPILAKSKKIEKRLDREKKLAAERRKVAHEKQERSRVDPVRVIEIPLNAYEKKLKKIATSGVVRLFNAIRDAQKKVEKVKSTPEGKSVNAAKISKEIFLSALAAPDQPTSSKPSLTSTTNQNTVSWLASSGMNEDTWDLES